MILAIYIALLLLTAIFYAHDWVARPGEIVDLETAIMILIVGMIWPVSLPFFIAHRLRKSRR